MPKNAWQLHKEIIKPHLGVFSFIFFLIFLGNALAFSIPYFLKSIADIALVTESVSFNFASVAFPLTAVTLILLFQEVCFRTAHYLEIVIVAKLRKALDLRILNALLDSPTAYFEDKLSGKIAKRANQIQQSYIYYIESLPWEIGWVVMGVVSSAILLFIAHPYLLLTFGLWLILFALTSVPLLKKMYVVSAVTAEKDAEYGGRYVDVIANVQTVHSFGATTFERKGLTRFLASYVESNKIEGKWSVLNKLQQGLSVVLLAFSLIVCGVWLYSTGVIGVTDFILIAGIVPAMNGMIWSAGDTCLNVLRKTSDMTNAIEELQSEFANLKAGEEKMDSVEKNIFFSNVHFVYPGTRESIFADLSLIVAPGQKVGIVGSSGAGKSTLIKLLLRQYDADSGTITIGDQNIKDVTLESLRQSISFVPQDTTLFHRSLLENIQYAKPDATLEEVIAVSKKAHTHDFIQTLPGQYDTLVGERGVKLSGGQRQRIAIARAMLKDAPILVLDEATSALDGESEKIVQEGFSELFAGRTVIAVAHRLSTLREMDRIVVIEEGKIVEDGTPAELLEIPNGIFKQKWEQQKDGFV